VAGALQLRFGCPAVMDNGVRLATVAEHHMGSGRHFDDVLYLSVGARIAAGMILGGQPRRGAHNVAGDIGRVAFRGPSERTGEIQWRSGRTAEEVFALARQQDPRARKELREFINELARGIATMVMAIDPAIVIIGGGMSLADDELLEPLREAIDQHIGLPLGLPVIASRLGAEAAVHGALVFAFGQCAEHIYRIGVLPPPAITPLTGRAPR
jgi:ROK family protein